MDGPLPAGAGEPAAARPEQEARRFTRPLHRCDSIGKLIVYYRELKGWSQKQLRMAVGLSQSRLSSLERDTRKPGFEELDRIAFLLEQSADRFSLLRRPVPPAPGS
jgi:ribosome-binding protein aMBF1 (putative translation factor)